MVNNELLENPEKTKQKQQNKTKTVQLKLEEDFAKDNVFKNNQRPAKYELVVMNEILLSK